MKKRRYKKKKYVKKFFITRPGVYRCFKSQRSGARKRGIPFYFTYPEWMGWWFDNLGPDWFEMRGPKSGQYVMARVNDFGPYHVSNVKCITCNENVSEIRKNNHNREIRKRLDDPA